MWELDYKESWVPKNWCFWTLMLEKTLESPLGCKQIRPVHPKEDQSWISIGRTDVEADTPVLQPPDVKNWLIWKDLDAGKHWRQEKRGLQRMRWLDDITDSMEMSLSRFRELVMANSGRPGMPWSMGLWRVGHEWATELNSRYILLYLKWITNKSTVTSFFFFFYCYILGNAVMW